MIDADILSGSEIDDAVAALRNRGRLTFEHKQNRDLVAKAAKDAGLTVRKGSIASQNMDPRYTHEGRNLPNLGLGNDYRHFFSKLYHLNLDRF